MSQNLCSFPATRDTPPPVYSHLHGNVCELAPLIAQHKLQHEDHGVGRDHGDERRKREAGDGVVVDEITKEELRGLRESTSQSPSDVTTLRDHRTRNPSGGTRLLTAKASSRPARPLEMGSFPGTAYGSDSMEAAIIKLVIPWVYARATVRA